MVGYLFNHKALAKVFRAKMLAGFAAAGLALPVAYPTAWVSDWIKQRAPIVCSCCGAVMRIVRTRIKPTLIRATPGPLAGRGTL